MLLEATSVSILAFFCSVSLPQKESHLSVCFSEFLASGHTRKVVFEDDWTFFQPLGASKNSENLALIKR